MRKVTTIVLLGSILLGGAAVAASLDGRDRGSADSIMGSGSMMGDNDGGGMMGMMKMMQQMSQMVDRCNSIMSDSRPNDQWRKNAPAEPDQHG